MSLQTLCLGDNCMGWCFIRNHGIQPVHPRKPQCCWEQDIAALHTSFDRALQKGDRRGEFHQAIHQSLKPLAQGAPYLSIRYPSINFHTVHALLVPFKNHMIHSMISLSTALSTLFNTPTLRNLKETHHAQTLHGTVQF